MYICIHNPKTVGWWHSLKGKIGHTGTFAGTKTTQSVIGQSVGYLINDT